jgi:dihydrofolate synthase/folylpolyglutamate synthase
MPKLRSISDAENVLLQFMPLSTLTGNQSESLVRMGLLLNLIGNPQDQLKVIHIAGTSGKTSTAYYIADLLRAGGQKVGLTISPHVDCVTERIQINGKPENEKQFCASFEKFLKIIDPIDVKPSYFELLFAYALWEFARHKVDYAVVETGIGGRFDATNILNCTNKICVITDIGLDHTRLLGKNLTDITWHKVGIVHSKNPTFMYQQNNTIMTVIRDWVFRQDAPLIAINESEELRSYAHDLQFMASFQQRNWLLAYRVYQFLKERDHLPTLSQRKLHYSQLLPVPARMEIRKIASKTVVMDGAHNLQKMKEFKHSFQLLYPNIRPVVLIGYRQRDDFKKTLPILGQLANHVIVTSIKSRYENLKNTQNKARTFKTPIKIPMEYVPDQQMALKKLLSEPNQVVVIVGSFHLLGQLRQLKPLK